MKERLDKALAFSNWLSRFLEARVQHLDTTGFDHKTLLLSRIETVRKPRGRFIFQNRWLDNSNWEELIMQVWDMEVLGFSWYVLSRKLQACKLAALAWNRGRINNLRVQILSLKI